MRGLADLNHPHTTTWTEAEEAFHFPTLTAYNIAADCLAAPADATALVEFDGDHQIRHTFAGLSTAAARFAALLADRGVAVGDRVAVKLPQGFAAAVAILGTLRAGAIVVTVSNVLGDDAILHRLRDSGARLLVCAGDDHERALVSRTATQLVAVTDPDWLQGYEPLVSFPATTPDTPALLLYTSGTSGKSKGVLHAHRVLLGHHAIDLAWDHVRPGDIAYSPVDWAWAGGLLLGLLVPLAQRMTVVAFREHRFDAARAVEIMRRAGVSVGLFPPTALRMLQRCGALTRDQLAGLRLRCLITGAEAVEPALAEWARDDLGLSLNNAFGQTEANALIGHAYVLGELDPQCLGRPYPGHVIAVLDGDQQPVAPGTIGEIAIRADDPVCMLRYWNAPEATSAKFRHGWLLTGDSAHVDASGNLFFHGRTDDIIKSGGYRIGPAEVEASLLGHPAVDQCAVVGVPDPERGQVVTAFVTLAAGASTSEELTGSLQARVRTDVGAHAYPRRIEYVDTLKKTSTGKVDRSALRRAASPAPEPGKHP